MNEKLIQDIFHLNNNLERKLKAYSPDNAFNFFKVEYENYFLPLYEEIVPELNQHLKNCPKDKKEQYYKFINQDWIAILETKLKNKALQNSANISICDYLVKDINMYIEAYEYKNDSEQKKQYILNFIKKKSNTIYKIIREDFELGIKTISQIKSPRVQFELIQCNKEIKNICQQHFSNIGNKEFYYYLSMYFCYPISPEIDIYYTQWKGLESLHIKFCREVMGDKYKEAKKFLKGSQ